MDTAVLRLYLPQGVKYAAGSAFLPNLMGRYFDAAEFEVVGERAASNLVLLPCNNPYRLSRKLAAIKGANVFAYDALPADDRAALRAGRSRLVLDMGHEMFFTRPDIIDGLHEGLEEIGVRRADMLLVNGDSHAAANYLRYCAAKGIADPVSMLAGDANALFFLAHQRMYPGAFDACVADVQAQRARRDDRRAFLNFNGRSRTHRLYAVLLLMSRGLMELGYVSLLDYENSAKGTSGQGYDPVRRRQAAERLRLECGNWPHAERCLPLLDTLLDRLPLELDLSAAESVVNKRYGHVTPWQMQDPELYQRSYFSLVTDSLLPDDGQLFVTEKVYKSFVGFHPFIYVGFAGALAHLRAMGFETFHPLIDESYDRDPSGARRLVKAIDELERLARLPQAELEALYAKLWPRLLHNARHARVLAPTWAKAKLEREIRRPLLGFGAR